MHLRRHFFQVAFRPPRRNRHAIIYYNRLSRTALTPICSLDKIQLHLLLKIRKSPLPIKGDMSYSETKMNMLFSIKKSLLLLKKKSSNIDYDSGMNSTSNSPISLKLPPSSVSLQENKGKNPLSMEPPISPLSLVNYQSRLFESYSLKNKISNIELLLSPPPLSTKIPLKIGSPDRSTRGLLNAVLGGSRIKSSEVVSKLMKEQRDRYLRLKDWTFKDWFNQPLYINLCDPSFRFFLCLTAGFTVWSAFVLSTVVVTPMGGLVDPLWLNENHVNFIRDSLNERLLYGDMGPGDGFVYPDNPDIKLQALRYRANSIIEENQRISGLDFDPLGINRTQTEGKMLLGFYIASLTLSLIAGGAFGYWVSDL